MGCKCNQGGRRGSRRPTIVPVRRPVANPSTQLSATQLRLQAIQRQNVPGQQGMDSERRRIEKLRRQAIQRSLNR